MRGVAGASIERVRAALGSRRGVQAGRPLRDQRGGLARAKKGDRGAALEPVRRAVHAHMGGFAEAIAAGLGLRPDWGSQYRARALQAEIKWLGIRSTSAYLGEPECNGVVERFIRLLKE